MHPSLPPQDIANLKGMLDLVQALSKKDFKDRFQELAEKMGELHEAGKGLKEQAEKLRAQTMDISGRESKLESKGAELHSARERLEAQAADQSKREQKLKDNESDAAAKDAKYRQDMAAGYQTLSSKNESAAKRETAVSKREQKADALQKEYEEKLAALKSMV